MNSTYEHLTSIYQNIHKSNLINEFLIDLGFTFDEAGQVNFNRCIKTNGFDILSKVLEKYLIEKYNKEGVVKVEIKHTTSYQHINIYFKFIFKSHLKTAILNTNINKPISDKDFLSFDIPNDTKFIEQIKECQSHAYADNYWVRDVNNYMLGGVEVNDGLVVTKTVPNHFSMDSVSDDYIIEEYDDSNLNKNKDTFDIFHYQNIRGKLLRISINATREGFDNG